VLINPTAYIPCGLMSIAAFLRKHGVMVRIQDHPFNLDDAEIVGISSMFDKYEDKVKAWAEYIKRNNPETTIVLGGNHASTFAEELIKLPYIDKVVVGEGEYAMLKIATREGGGIYKESFLNINEIPMPAYDLVDMSKYIGKAPYSLRANIPIVSSRGCPNDCAYCTVKAIWNRTWRGKKPSYVVDEIEYLKNTYGVTEFSFFDDSVSIDKQRLEGICNEIIRRKLKIKWTTPNGVAYWTLSKPLVKLMKKAGCYRLTFGIESGQPRIRSYVGKDYLLAQATKLIKYANSIGMWTITTNIIGLPYENLKDMEQTLKYAKDCGTDFACFYQLTIHKGTKVYKDRDKILIKGKELDHIEKRMYKDFIMSRVWSAPFRLLGKIRSWEDFKYTIQLIKQAIKILIRVKQKKGCLLYDNTR